MTTDVMESESPTRRKLLNLGLGVFGFISALGVVYPLGAYLWPRESKRGKAAARSLKFPASELPIGEAKFVRFINKPTVVLRPNEQELIALSAICTHLGCVVKWHEDKHLLICPCHGGQFDVKGAVVAGPPPKPLPAYSARMEGEYIIIEEA